MSLIAPAPLTMERSCREMYALAASEGEAELLAECTAAASALAARAQKLKVTALLSALGDAADASAYVEVTAGAGGLEAALWASMLVKMYSKWAQAKNYSVRLDAEHKVEGSTGVKSATLVIDGQQAYG
jgi:peptide chain release factor 2